MSVLVLSRKNIIRRIDQDTPLPVLQEISQCHKIMIDERFYENLKHKPIGIVHSPPREEDWVVIAQYVNPNSTWSIAQLQQAYAWLNEWVSKVPELPVNFTYGIQTNISPMNVNACMLYKFCKEHGLPVNRSVTLYQLATIVRMYIGDAYFSRAIVYNIIDQMDKIALINVYLKAVHQDTTLVEDNYATFLNNINDAVKCFSDRVAMRMFIQPKTRAEAITLAAMNYHIDLFHASDPIREYHIIQCDPSGYYPQDADLLKSVSGNLRLINLRETFNPMLPIELYDEQTLITLAKFEGYSNIDLQGESPYTLMQTVCFSNTFYQGRQSGIANARTPFLYEDVDEIHDDLLLCYGCLASKIMIAFSYQELTELFRFNKNFVNPLDNQPFPDIAIAKLKNLCKQFRIGENLEEKNKLYTAIINTEIFTDETQQLVKEFYVTFEQGNAHIKAKISDAILALFHLSMYMRGWLGQGEYPVERAPVDNQNIVDLQVTEGIITFERHCQELGEIGEAILNLPLLKYKHNRFHRVINEEHGKTVGERLQITKAGEEHTTFDSCIRLTSNYFVATSYRYMQVLGLPLPFDIDRLREIS